MTEAANSVRYMIARGMLQPGDAVTIARLAAETGICASYCQRALHALVADGTLKPAVRGGPFRVPGGTESPG